jgi:hypothetical protein
LEALNSAQKAFGDRTEKAILEIQKLPVDGSSIGPSIEKVRAMFSATTSEESTLMELEQNARWKASQAGSFLTGIKASVYSGNLQNCETISSKVTDLNALADKWSAHFESLYQTLASTSAKRLKLRDNLSSTLQNWLLQQSSNATVTSLTELTTIIEDAFKADRFNQKVAIWWGQVYGGRGPAHGNARIYRQHEGTLRTLRSDIIKADQLVAEAKSLKLDPAIEAQVVSFVEGHKNVLTIALNQQSSKSWTDMFLVQKAMLEHYEKNSANNTTLCNLNVLKHKKTLQSVKTSEDFMVKELGYMAVADACRK